MLNAVRHYNEFVGQEGIALAIFDCRNKCSHNNCNICGERHRKAGRGKRNSQTVSWGPDYDTAWGLALEEEREVCISFSFGVTACFSWNRGKWALQTQYASLCRTNRWEDPAWGGKGTLKYSCTCALSRVCCNREELHHNPLQPVEKDEEIGDECILS